MEITVSSRQAIAYGLPGLRHVTLPEAFGAPTRTCFEPHATVRRSPVLPTFVAVT